jgi:hypothetical protein
MSEEERKRKRERNNESVRKCRQNEKKKINTASEELDNYKKEYRELEEKYLNLQKELQTLKSLFQAPLQVGHLNAAVAATLTQPSTSAASNATVLNSTNQAAHSQTQIPSQTMLPNHVEVDPLINISTEYFKLILCLIFVIINLSVLF